MVASRSLKSTPAASRSLTLSLAGKRQVEDALINRKLSIDDLKRHAEVGIATVKKFRACKPVDKANFVAFCEFLELDWKAVAEGYAPEPIAADTGNPNSTMVLDRVVPEQHHEKVMGAEIQSVPLWVGRDDLLKDLTADLTAGRKVLALVGQGGIGKTSLAVKLLEACGLDLAMRRLNSELFAGILYVKVGEETAFEAIADSFCASLGLAMRVDTQTWWEKLAPVLRSERWLVVLDNLESGLDAVTGLAVKRELGDFLNAFVMGNWRSQMVITSREKPLDLADRRGKRIDAKVVRVEPIMGIAIADSIALLQDYAPDIAVEDLRWIAEKVEGQVFVLMQLGNLLREKSIGYLRKAQSVNQGGLKKSANLFVAWICGISPWELQDADHHESD